MLQPNFPGLILRRHLFILARPVSLVDISVHRR